MKNAESQNPKNRTMARLFLVPAVLWLGLSAGACSSYSYYDLDLKFGSGFDVVKIGSIYSCHLVVTGASSDDVVLDPAHCKTATTGELGTVEYSTFADSGNITFTLKAFQYPEANPNCELGEGSTTLAAGNAVRKTGTVTAMATTPAGPCQ